MHSATSAGPRRWRRPPILILGAHRSGTSATAHALQLLGLQIGQRLDSHYESKALQRLHEEYLRKVGATWYQPQPFLDWVQTPEGERDCLDYLRANARHPGLFGYRRNPRGLYLLARLKLGSLWGWKEPRTTLFAPLWLKLFPGARIIDVIRHPLSVALSLRQRELRFRTAGDSPAPQLDDVHYCLRIALAYVEAGERLAAQTVFYRRIRFEDLQADPSGTLKELALFCDLRPSGFQLDRAAATIKPEMSRHWESVLTEETKDLLSSYPVLARLGYGL
jgi:Sulfotransferase family